MNMSLSSAYHTSGFLGLVSKNKANSRTKKDRFYVTLKVSSVLLQTGDENENRAEPSKTFSAGKMDPRQRRSCQASNTLLSQPNTIGIIGGVSAFSTLLFLEKLVLWGSRCGKYCPPFVVCSDSTLQKKLSLVASLKPQVSDMQPGFGPYVESLKMKMAFLEESGASCMVMPCHLSHLWHSEITEDCSLPFLHVGECVAKELSEANLRPLEVGSNVKIGVLATNEALMNGIYQGKLENQGFEVVLPDKATMEHIVIPSEQALKSRDVKGARNLLKIAVQILLTRGVNTVVIASDEMQGLLPYDDPLLQKCTDPMDALARSAISWAKAKENVKI